MNEMQYETILSALADKIKSQEETILCQRWQIERLEIAVKEAEAQTEALAITKTKEGEHR